MYNTLLLSLLIPLQERYFAIQEASIYGWVAPGYYVPSVQAISVEGETGILMAPQSIVAVGSSEGELPGFTGRGYAVLEFTSSERVSSL